MSKIKVELTKKEIIDIMTILHCNIKDTEKKMLELQEYKILEKDPEYKEEINDLIEFYRKEINSTVSLLNIFRYAK